jgi:predicted Zn-dependent protease
MSIKSGRPGIAALALAATLSLAVATPLAFAREPEKTDGVKVGNPSIVRKLVSAEQVERAGSQQYAQLVQKSNREGVLLLENHPTVQRVRKIAENLLPFANKFNERAKDWQWEVNVFKAPTINAFCMPGGKIAFFTGIIDTLKLSDDEIAMVMGHEIAHALREHARERMAKSQLTNFGIQAVAILLGQTAGVLAQAGGGLYSLKFSRGDETDADLVGMELAARAGYNPESGIVLWQKMGAANKGAPPQWMSTHPANTTRIQTIKDHLKEVMPLYEAAAKGRRG